MFDYMILVVDDEPAQVDALAGFLKKLGYGVRKADSAEKALEIVRSEPVDLVLTDMRMPGMDGVSLVREIKRQNSEIDVIVMTAFGSVESAVEAMKNGALDYLSKPIDLDQLEVVVEKARERRQLISENRWLRTNSSHKVIVYFIANI